MSQMTFDGFIEGNGADAVASQSTLPETPRADVPRAETWYKGRVLSHSSIALYRTCPQRWKFRYIDKVPEKPRSHFSFGKSVHTALEFLFAQTGQPWPALDLVLGHYREKWMREGYESAVQEKWFFQEGERIIKGFYAKHQKDAKTALQVEYKFTIDVEGVPVMGYIDRVDRTPSGGLAIVDYKTGKAFDKSRVKIDPQLTLYQIACQKSLGAPVESVTLYHLNSLTPLTMPAHSRKQEDEYKMVVVESAKGITEQKFEAKPDERGHCLWCDYAQICPALANKKSALTTGASQALAELTDKYGKLRDRLETLQAEAKQVESDLTSRLRATNQTEAHGEFYQARLQVTDDGVSSLAVDLKPTKPAA